MRRTLALVIAALALGGMVWQFQINASKPGLAGVGIRLWLMVKYFTNLANAMVAVHMAAAAFRPVRANASAMVTLSIVMVGLIYWRFIALPEPMPVPHWYPDFLLHRLVPVLAAFWWLAYGEKGLRLRDVPLWIMPAVLYCPYALLRGVVTGIYPYPFLDLGRLGAVQVAVNVGGLLLAFAAGGAMLWLVAAVLRRVE